MNILIKLTSIVALIIAPHLNEGATGGHTGGAAVQPVIETPVVTAPVIDGAAARGVENRLLAFIASDRAADKATWFNFDRITFKTGSVVLARDRSGEQLKNVANILASYPNIELKLGGYTDNTGSDEVNMKLSQERADAVKAALVSMHVAPARLRAEGYGPQHPIASNETEAGRAQNRRMALRVAAK